MTKLRIFLGEKWARYKLLTGLGLVSSHEQLGYPFTKWSEQMRLFKVRFVPTNSSMGDLSVMGRLTEAAPPSKYTASFWEGLLFDEMEVAVSEKAASAAFNKSLSRKYM